MADIAAPIDSEALRVNAPTTAGAVSIPPRFLPLLSAVESFYGVHAGVSEILREHFHTYRHLDSVIAGLGTLQLRYWPHLARAENRAELFDLVTEMTTSLLELDLTHERASALLRSTILWCTAVIASEYAAELDAQVAGILHTLEPLLERQPSAVLERDTLLRELVASAPEKTATYAAATDLYRRTLLVGYDQLAERMPVPIWAHSPEAALTDPESVASLFAHLDPDSLGARRAALETMPDLRGDIATFTQLGADAINHLPQVPVLQDRFALALYLLKDGTLGYRQQQVMSDLLLVVKKLVQPGRKLDTEALLARLTAFFRERDDEFLLTRFQCYEVIGCAIGEANNERAADALINDILSWRFQYPEIAGTTDEWETLVNPYHLPKIRCWLAIIESNPALFERLAAALNVQLRLGGVHIADTDLFQRDVTKLLNSDIAPIYFVAKQLLRVFPVYFAEVGAEGELRAVTTQFDELTQRKDSLLHFLRKSVHAESSNRLVPFAAAVIRYWATLDARGLEPYLPASTLVDVCETQRTFAEGPHTLLQQLRVDQQAENDTVDEFVDKILELDQQWLLDWAASRGPQCFPQVAPDEAVRLARVVRTYQLLQHKYTLTSDDAAVEVGRFAAVTPEARHAFTAAHTDWRENASAQHRDALLDAALDVLEELRAIILDPQVTVADEQLYHKRHIAAGIPSLYGNYREPKFDALGLSLRVENLVGRLLEDVVTEGMEPYITRDTLRRMAATMRRFERTIAIDGVASASFSDCLRMLEASFGFHSFSFHQYENVFSMLARAMSELSGRSVRSHAQILRQTLDNDPRQCIARGLSVDVVSEMVIREVLVSGLGIQTLDRYVGQAQRKLSSLNDELPPGALTRMMNYDPERLVLPIHGERSMTPDLPTVGFKGMGLMQMADAGLHVPEGFVLSTELYHAQPALKYTPLYVDTVRRIGEALHTLEHQTGLRYADPTAPLLLSVRSGSPVSMPGLMTTFVNVGINEEVAEALAAREGFGWAAWDSYRRFIQSWAMYEGTDRDIFDAIMNDAKARTGVAQKRDFTVEQMREMCFAYRDAALADGIELPRDPFEALIQAVLKVAASWDKDDPKLYREYTHLAENWGTAVTCQRMVFGNLGDESGSGVAFTSNPLEPFSHQVRLFGDFGVGTQGEDLVGGLVFPLPLSEAQREASATYQGTTDSLESRFPAVYEALLDVARSVVDGPNSDPQEIEFTFEGPRAEDLYILQKRAVVQEQVEDAPYVDVSDPHVNEPVAFAMGVSGGAYPGRVALNSSDVDRLRAQDERAPIILVRPDTVPEDLALATRVDALLTARGGATSHAAVTAKRLAKTAVVGCHALEVREREGEIVLAGQRVPVGQWITIDGRSGSIYVGCMPTVARPRRA